jgi:hypothetical protein
MKRILTLALFLILLLPSHAGLGADRDHPDANRATSRFTHVDLYLDPKGQPLAAWQLEFAAEVGKVSLVGVEAGEHPAYSAKPPYYDPAALAGNRIILADFTLDPNPPNQKTRIARLMLEIRGDTSPQYATKLITAATAEGKRITAELTIVQGGTGSEPKPAQQ